MANKQQQVTSRHIGAGCARRFSILRSGYSGLARESNLIGEMRIGDQYDRISRIFLLYTRGSGSDLMVFFTVNGQGDLKL